MKCLFSLVSLVLLGPASLTLAQNADNDAAAKAVVAKVQALIDANDLAEAEQALDAGLKANPESVQIASLLRVLANYELHFKRNKQAVTYAVAYFDGSLKRFETNPEMVAWLPSAAGTLSLVCSKAKQSELSLSRQKRAIAAVRAQHEKEPKTNLATALASLVRIHVEHLVELDQSMKAKVVLDAELQSARRAYALNRKELGNIVALANLLDVQANLLEKTARDKEPAARREFREFLAAQAKERPSHIEIADLYLHAKIAEFYEVVQADVEAAQKIQAGLKEYLAHLEGDSPQLNSLSTRGAQLVQEMSRQIESSKAHLAMIAKPATELDVETWVNGAPLTDKGLAGKVVLLDFWAVWCGPCIATFPQLTQWHEEYADKGLVILGMTQFYEYDWNEVTGESEKVSGLAPELERAALAKFAAHHKLKHRIAVMPTKSEFSASYGVKGIPQAVLVDRSGKVRMIRVGSGSRNAYDLEEAIKQAIAVPAVEAGE